MATTPIGTAAYRRLDGRVNRSAAQAVTAYLAQLATDLPPMPDHAATVHSKIMQAIAKDGHLVYAEVPSLEESRAGRIDLAFYHRHVREWCAIEIDARKPRKRSLIKLRLFPGVRVVMLRGIEGSAPLDGIDAVISLPVRLYEDREINKSAVGRVSRILRESRTR